VLNGGTNAANNPSSYTIAELPRTINNPTRNGYTFQGWTAKYSDSHTDVTNPTTYYSIPSGVTGLVTLTANWTPAQYSITYTLNSGTNAAGNPASYNIDSTVIIGNPTRTGYNFLGWTVTYANTTQVTNQIGYTIPMGSYGNVALTANWDSANEYPITYALNDGANAVNNPDSYTITTYPRTINNPTRVGYTFQGWTVKYSDGRADITTPTTYYSIPSDATGQITLTANWTPVQYYITYTLNGGINAADNPATYNLNTLPITIPNPTRANYEFLGWTVRYANGTEATGQSSYRIPAGTTGNIGLTANWRDASTSDPSGSGGGGSGGGGSQSNKNNGQSGTNDNTQPSYNPNNDGQPNTNDNNGSNNEQNDNSYGSTKDVANTITIVTGIAGIYFRIAGWIMGLFGL